MIFSALKALTGDSIVISWKDNAIVIDGGMPNTFNFIKNKLDGKNLKAIFVTHVDYDHIGGIINLIKDDDIDFSVCGFYMNNPDLAVNYNGTEVKYSHGDTLKVMLDNQGHEFSPITNNQEPIFIDGMKITTLLPSEAMCLKLYSNWNASRIIDDEEVTYLERQKNHGDIINKSSVVLLLEYNNVRMLMLGDSHADDVADSITLLPCKKFDMVKLSHHGSAHNTNAILLRLIECVNYSISTNGNGNARHPHSETIKLLSDRAVQLGQNFNIYLNYDIESDIREKCNFPIQNLNFIFQENVEL